MGQELALPDWAKTGPSKAFTILNPTDDSLSDGIGQSYAVIGYKGKVWSLRHRGEKHNFVRPDDGTPSTYLDVIILGQAKQKSKSFYKKYDPGTSDGERPICSSIDGVLPDGDVVQKQSDTCALCPRNVWKQDPQTGRKGRECTDYKRLAVLVLPSMSKRILGQPLMEPAFLRVPPASLNSLAIMGDGMSAQGFHYSSYITRITFDPDKPHPEMQFRPIQGLSDQEASVILPLREDGQVGRIVSGDNTAAGPKEVQGSIEVLPQTVNSGLSTGAVSGQQTGTQTPAGTNGNGATASVATPQTVSTPAASAPLATGFGDSPAQATQTVASPGPNPSVAAVQASTQSVDTGFGGATVAPTPPAPAPAPAALDVGQAEATDPDLDARIANLIKGGA